MALYNRRSQKETRRRLRTHGTPAEAVLWRHLKGKRLGGLRWRRQFGVGPYVLDFYCPAVRLGVEVDGAVHASPERRAYDAERTRHLGAVGIAVVRFANDNVFRDPEAVGAAILAAARAHAGANEDGADET